MAMSPTKPSRYTLRPTLVIAEALLDRQEPSQIVDRARELGFSQLLTNAMVGACCGQHHCDQPTSTAPKHVKTLKVTQS